jgi:hypothetical protein
VADRAPLDFTIRDIRHTEHTYTGVIITAERIDGNAVWPIELNTHDPLLYGRLQEGRVIRIEILDPPGV